MAKHKTYSLPTGFEEPARRTLEELLAQTPKPVIAIVAILGTGDAIKLIPIIQALLKAYPGHSFLVLVKRGAEVFGLADWPSLTRQRRRLVIVNFPFLERCHLRYLESECSAVCNVCRWFRESSGERMEVHVAKTLTELDPKRVPDPVLLRDRLPDIPAEKRPRFKRPFFTFQNDGCWHGSMKELPPPDVFRTVGMLKAKYRFLPVQVGGKDDREYDCASYDMRGQLTLFETYRLITEAKFHIGSDTGLAHAAAALRVPTITWFGPTEAAVVSDSWRCSIIGPGTCETHWRSECPFVPYPQCPYTDWAYGCLRMPDKYLIFDNTVCYLTMHGIGRYRPMRPGRRKTDG